MSSATSRSFWLYKKRGMLKKKQNYEKFFILDFEATCEENEIIKPQEIIEFPCLLVDGNDFSIKDQFHTYVQPEVFRILSPFCSSLTGIHQGMVDNKPTFKTVLKDFSQWLQLNYDSTNQSSIFVTCGNWDLKVILPDQCRLHNLQVPHQMLRWINLKTEFFRATGYYPKSLRDMIGRLNIPLRGKLHSGIGDCKNIVAVMKTLAEKGHLFRENNTLEEY